VFITRELSTAMQESFLSAGDGAFPWNKQTAIEQGQTSFGKGPVYKYSNQLISVYK